MGRELLCCSLSWSTSSLWALAAAHSWFWLSRVASFLRAFAIPSAVVFVSGSILKPFPLLLLRNSGFLLLSFPNILDYLISFCFRVLLVCFQAFPSSLISQRFSFTLPSMTIASFLFVCLFCDVLGIMAKLGDVNLCNLQVWHMPPWLL